MALRYNAISNQFDLVGVGSGGGSAGYQASATVASTANLSADYDNGTLGVGATLTNNGAQVALQLDGVALSFADRVLIKNQTAEAHNGIYQVDVVGTGATNWVLSRVSNYDESAEINPGTVIAIIEGSTQSNTLWQQQNEVTTVGTDPIVFTAISGGGSDVDDFTKVFLLGGM